MIEMNWFRRIKIVMLSGVMVLMGVSAGCGGVNGLKDGFYTAEMSEFSHGWQEYLIIQVKGGEIVSAEYNA
ncbi:MAG: FMN-binding protein, partial [Lachnospiraceae bacterium]|nr:FMN-binding protein [Lachnospiraceae bacterium]